MTIMTPIIILQNQKVFWISPKLSMTMAQLIRSQASVKMLSTNVQN